MKKEYLFILALTISCFISKAQTSSTLSGTTPLNFTSLGTGTYNKTVIYHQSSGLLFDLAKSSDSPSGVPINFAVDARGGGHNFFMINGSTGNVGIGTSSPYSALEVLRTTAEGTISVNSGGSTEYSSYGWKAGGVRKWSVYQHPTLSHALLFMNEFGQDVLTVKQDGRIGVGTINPDAKLAVKGTIHAEEVKVDLSVPWPDYVFEKDYPLTSLEELKTYIDQHKHLPEIPSAKEMEENGINLKEMNLLLLKKVEELTIHLIEQNKQMEENRLRAEAYDKKFEKMEQEIQRLKNNNSKP